MWEVYFELQKEEENDGLRAQMFVYRVGNHWRPPLYFFPAIVSDLRVSVPYVPPLLVESCAVLRSGDSFTPSPAQPASLQPQSEMLGCLWQQPLFNGRNAFWPSLKRADSQSCQRNVEVDLKRASGEEDDTLREAPASAPMKNCPTERQQHTFAAFRRRNRSIFQRV